MDADFIHCQEHMINRALKAVMPDRAVKDAVAELDCDGRLFVVSAGKAAWQMANASYSVLGDRIQRGIVITKYGHVREEIPKFICFEAGHPVPDENTFNATEKAVEMVRDLDKKDKVLFLLSGGGSALFEKPLIPFEELKYITQKLLASGADIREINTVRKHLSAVKGGRFAELCSPASVFTVVLSDVLGNDPAVIASGPTCADSSTCGEALDVINKYGIPLSEEAQLAIRKETPKELLNSEISVNGSVKELCAAAAEAAAELGFETTILTDELSCEAKDAGSLLGTIAVLHQDTGKSLAFIAGGETVVKVTGKGTGGRNQELVLAAAKKLKSCRNTFLFSFGSDGTDGPTDAAGGRADENTYDLIAKKTGKSVKDFLENNDSYNALKAVDGLIFTGPTGTNVNDVAVLLIKR